jgi:pimeloyl-ACP methyl ester carboxylesterase
VTTSGRKQLTIGSVDLAYNDEGAGAPPLLLLHGYTGAASDFADVTPPLAASRRVVAYDQRGHGDSTNTGDAATYTFHQLTDDLTGFVDALDLAPIDLLGHSMGGIIAMRYVLAHPERVRSLVLMDTAAAPAGAMPKQIRDGLVSLAHDEGMPAVFAVIKEFLTNAGMAEALIERMRRKFERLDPEAFGALAEGLETYASLIERLPEISCPTTVIVGELDAGLRASADVLALSIEGAHLAVIEGAGHSPQEDRPDEWVAVVEAHLARA